MHFTIHKQTYNLTIKYYTKNEIQIYSMYIY